jgi:hypothetical protein
MRNLFKKNFQSFIQILILGFALYFFIIAISLKDHGMKEIQSLIALNDQTQMVNLYREIADSSRNYFFFSLSLIVIAFLLPRIENITLPGGASLQLKKDIETVKAQVDQLQKSTIDVGGKGVQNIEEVKEKKKKGIASATLNNLQVSNDPQKGRWGLLADRNNRKLSATVTERPYGDFYDVLLTVESTNQLYPLQWYVQFHLHNTFNNPDPIVQVTNGKAELRLTAWGAFTVGAEADMGLTKLELDLAELPNVPEKFRAL